MLSLSGADHKQELQGEANSLEPATEHSLKSMAEKATPPIAPLLNGTNRKRPINSQPATKVSTAGAAQVKTQVKTTKAVSTKEKDMLAKERSDVAHAKQVDSSDEEDAPEVDSDDDQNQPNLQHKSKRAKNIKNAEGAVPSPQKTPTTKPKKKQTKLKPLRLKPREILSNDPLCSQIAAEPPLDKGNAGGRFVLAPPSQWAEYAQKDSGGFIGKFLKVINSSAQIQFNDGKVWFDWDVASQFKPLN